MAAKTESNFKNMVLALFLVTGIAALALGGVYVLTKEPIAIAKQKKLEAAIKAVLPEFDTITIYKAFDPDGDSLTLYRAEKEGKPIGVAVETYTNKGFGGTIDVMVGFSEDGTITNTSVLSLKETPGLGDKLQKSKSNFSDQFIGKNPANFKLLVKKDGGDVDAITAATISSRAFCDALQRAFDTYEKNKEK